MNKETLKKLLIGKKVQDSVNCENLATTLKELGFKGSNKNASFYIIDEVGVVPVSAFRFQEPR